MGLLYSEESYAIRDAAMEVHKLLGSGMHEIVCGEHLKLNFALGTSPTSERNHIRYNSETLW